MKAAILFLVFNRPDTTSRVFEAIRRARPPRLYVAADGPRVGTVGEQQRCKEVRRIATAVDWPCELVTLLREDNMGCGRAPSSAISWFFEHEAEGIVLEDDCLPDSSFFSYCDELLERYRDDPRVMCISGDNFISAHWRPADSYYFSRYAHSWGWATWRRAWASFDFEMKDLLAGTGAAVVERRLQGEPRAAAYWKENFARAAGDQIDIWDYQWLFACWRQEGLSCIPATNLISNIGFGEGATHTTSPESKLANLAVAPLELPLRHPDVVEANQAADQWTSEHVFGIDERQSSSSLVRDRMKGQLRRAWTRVTGLQGRSTAG